VTLGIKAKANHIAHTLDYTTPAAATKASPAGMSLLPGQIPGTKTVDDEEHAHAFTLDWHLTSRNSRRTWLTSE